ncbi:GrpB family protein [Chitinophaga sp. NPDC101104]|uniref:GrpB family protein n=1 Tax=Chitinophaga sp. NPDC101104 TaxID=3390561 RepID=UPI003D05A9F1
MKVVIAPYDPLWPDAYAAQQRLIAEALGHLFPVIDHIGSTSVPGLAAKPVIDILVGVASDEWLDATIEPMNRRGYTYFRKYEPSMPYRRFFALLDMPPGEPAPWLVDIGDPFVTGGPIPSLVNIHIMVKNTWHWKRHLAMRDFLRSHPDVADAYAALKIGLSAREFGDTNEYNAAKDAFVKSVEQRALAWWKG